MSRSKGRPIPCSAAVLVQIGLTESDGVAGGLPRAVGEMMPAIGASPGVTLAPEAEGARVAFLELLHLEVCQLA